MNNKILIFVLIISVVLVLISLGMFLALNSSNFSDLKDDKILIEKAEQEIKFLENKVISMTNKLNNINFFNSVLTEEKSTSINQNSEKEKDNQSSQSSSETEQEDTMTSKQESSGNSQLTKASSTNENTKYEVANGGILINGDNIEIDWDYMKANIEIIYTILPTIITDLNMLNVNSEDILNFSNTLDKTTLSIKDEEKSASLSNLVGLYAFLPNYRSQISNNMQKSNIDFTINCILNSYALVEENKWNEAKEQLANAINYYVLIMDGVNENIQNQNRISKAYILLNELNNCVEFQNKELFFIKYRNVMEELISI